MWCYCKSITSLWQSQTFDYELRSHIHILTGWVPQFTIFILCGWLEETDIFFYGSLVFRENCNCGPLPLVILIWHWHLCSSKNPTKVTNACYHQCCNVKVLRGELKTCIENVSKIYVKYLKIKQASHNSEKWSLWVSYHYVILLDYYSSCINPFSLRPIPVFLCLSHWSDY